MLWPKILWNMTQSSTSSINAAHSFTLHLQRIPTEPFQDPLHLISPGRAFPVTWNVLPGPLITSLISQEYYRFSLSLSRSSFPHPNPVIPTHSLHLFQSFGNWLHFCNYVVFAWSLLLVIGSIYKMKKKNEVVDQWRDGWTLHTYYVPGPLPVLGKQQRIQHTLPSWRQSPWRQKWETGIVGALGRDKGGWKEAKGRPQHLLCWKWNPAYICTTQNLLAQLAWRAIAF